MEQRELAELYERLCQKPPGSFRCLYQNVPIFEVQNTMSSYRMQTMGFGRSI